MSICTLTFATDEENYCVLVKSACTTRQEKLQLDTSQTIETFSVP
jgi:hypothetical protein